jgi:hypothetical protein
MSVVSLLGKPEKKKHRKNIEKQEIPMIDGT